MSVTARLDDENEGGSTSANQGVMLGMGWDQAGRVAKPEPMAGGP